MKVKLNMTKLYEIGVKRLVAIVNVIPALHPMYDYKFIFRGKMYYCNEEDILEYVMEFDEKEFEI